MQYTQAVTAKVLNFARHNTISHALRSLVRDVGWKKFTFALVIGVLVGGFVFSIAFSSKGNDIETVDDRPYVTLEEVGSISTGNDKISLVGTVESRSEATIYTESAGIITYVSYSLGDSVSRGAVIGEIENSRERALVLGARATLAQVKSAQVRDTTDVYANATNVYRQAFTRASDAIFGKTDVFFSAPRTSAPRLTISSFGESTLEADRARINDILSRWEEKLPSASAREDISNLLNEAERDTALIKLFLDQLASIVNRQTANGSKTEATIESEKSALFGARSNIDTSLLSITSIINTLSQTLSEENGGTGESDAKVNIAEASLASVLASLQKTIIRTPISGTINALDIRAGDFVNAFTPVATIANNTALEIATFISNDDKERLAVGDQVEIEGNLSGTVTKIAPALNPITKKIEVRIAVADDIPTLVNGSTVRIEISPTKKTSLPGDEATIRIPLEALKLEGGNAFVFSVNKEKNTLVAHPVMLGDIIGTTISISGIEKTILIVTDVRGLSEGQVVQVKN